MFIRAITFAAVVVATAAQADPVAAPPGAVQFCLREPSFCNSHPDESAPQSAMTTILRDNAEINAEIIPASLNTDSEKRMENANWRVVMPGGLGDCVEFALTKMQKLAWDGIPMGAMRLAQVKIPSGELHMVLLVRVNGVQNVLDNLTKAVWGPEQTNYQFLAIQNGRIWETPTF